MLPLITLLYETYLKSLVELVNSLEARWQTNIKKFPSDICTYFGFSLIIPLCQVMYAW